MTPGPSWPETTPSFRLSGSSFSCSYRPWPDGCPESEDPYVSMPAETVLETAWPPEDEPEEQQPEQPDPLERLDDESREAIQARWDAEKAALAKQHQEAMEAYRKEQEDKLQADKSALNLRAKERLRDQAGIEWREDGSFVPVDPLRAASFLSQGASPAPSAPDPLDAPIDYFTDNAETIKAKNERLVDRQVRERLDPIIQRLEKAEQAALQAGRQATAPILTGIPGQARESLKEYGLDYLADHPKFAQMVTDAVQKGFAQEYWGNPEAIAAAALSLAPTLRTGVQRPQVQPPSATPTQAPPRPRDDGGRYVSEAARADLGAAAPSRGIGSGAPRQTVQLDDDDRDAMRSCGISDPREFALLANADKDPDAYIAFQRQKSGLRNPLQDTIQNRGGGRGFTR